MLNRVEELVEADEDNKGYIVSIAKKEINILMLAILI
jgi:hypothetical protein